MTSLPAKPGRGDAPRLVDVDVHLDGAPLTPVTGRAAAGEAWSADVFRAQVRAGLALGRPLRVEAPDDWRAALAVLRGERAHEVGGLLLGFGADPVALRRILVRGFHLLVRAADLDAGPPALEAALRAVPADHLVLGAGGDPARLAATARRLAALKGLTLEDVARITSRNADRVLDLGGPQSPTRIAYPIRRSLYLNVTNRCTNACTFCAKFKDFVVKGHELRLEREPDADEVMAAIGDPTGWEEVVFCGYGEPLLRLDLVREVARRLKEVGMRIRVNTDGQASLVHGRNVVPELVGLVDAVSVSLNAPDAATYQKYCRSRFGEAAYEGVLEFIRQSVRLLPSVTATAVTLPGLDVDACRRVAESLGAGFRAREYQELG